jgi:hypothetical protein
MRIHGQDYKETTYEAFQKRSITLAMPGEVRIALQTCHTVQSASVSSISESDKILSAASHIDESTTPRKNTPNRLSTGIKEGIAIG